MRGFFAYKNQYYDIIEMLLTIETPDQARLPADRSGEYKYEN